MNPFLNRILLATAILLPVFVTPVMAQDQKAAVARMDQRLAKVVELKGRGAVGENNRGLLEVRTPGEEVTKVVADENKDREEVYAALARQTGSSADAVGRARARSIATSAPAGTWLQREDGVWYRK